MNQVSSEELPDGNWPQDVAAGGTVPWIEEHESIPVPHEGFKLTASVFRSHGAARRPVLIFNDGQNFGDPRAQRRNRPLSVVAPFTQAGFLVVAPNRRGVADSEGQHVTDPANGFASATWAARDVAAAVAWAAQHSLADPKRLVVAGVSFGGLASLAYAGRAIPGVRGIVNFGGGLRPPVPPPGWQDSLRRSFNLLGLRCRLPSLWLYADNDELWPGPVSLAMHASFSEHRHDARYLNLGDFDGNAHMMVLSRRHIPRWWPAVNAFLAELGIEADPLEGLTGLEHELTPV